jgi:hypothetical protein
MNAIDLFADFGLVAIILATLNICVGVLIAVRYSPVRCWPHLRFEHLSFAQLDWLSIGSCRCAASCHFAIERNPTLSMGGHRSAGLVTSTAAGKYSPSARPLPGLACGNYLLFSTAFEAVDVETISLSGVRRRYRSIRPQPAHRSPLEGPS